MHCCAAKQPGKKDPRDVILKTGILAQALPVANSDLEIREINLKLSPEEMSDTFNLGSDKSPFLSSGYYRNGIAYTLKTQSIKVIPKKTLGDVLLDETLIPENYWIPDDRLAAWKELKDAKSIERTHKGSGAKYFYAEGKMAFPDLLENPSRTILTGEGGNTPSRFKHIIKIDNKWRRLTPIELERLNGFPDDWTKFDSAGKTMSDGRRAFFMGNALVVGLIEKVGRVIAKEIAATSSDH